jgi:flagellar hook-associated protein 2
MRQISSASGTGSNGRARFSVSLNEKGSGLQIVDNTGSTTSNLIITGNNGADTAASLGISTGAGGVSATTVKGSNLQKKYVSRAMLLADLNKGSGVGTGKFRITDSTGSSAVVELATTDKTLGDVIDKINSRGLHVTARVNSHGDGIEVVETSGTNGTSKIKIADESGTAAKSLNLVGEASGTGTSNKIDGSYEKVVTFASTDTLQNVITKINAANAGVSASIIRDGNGSSPFKIAFAATGTGTAGRVIMDAGSFDLGLNQIDAGQDAKIFYGSSDPARGILVSSSTNTLDNVISGVQINLKSSNSSAVQLTVSRDSAAIETKVDDFISSFNDLVDRIDKQSTYDATSKKSGALLGDSTSQTLRRELFKTVQAKTIGNVGRYDSFANVGITVGSDGNLKVDKTKLRAAISEDSAAVEALFDAKTLKTPSTDANARTKPDEYLQLGIVGQIENLGKRYTDSADGILTQKQTTLRNLQKSLQSTIDDYDVRLTAKREILQKQFAAMESTIGGLQTQQSFLSSLG